jgi:hypothetical protein
MKRLRWSLMHQSQGLNERARVVVIFIIVVIYPLLRASDDVRWLTEQKARMLAAGRILPVMLS